MPDAREDRALAALNADPDVRYAAPDVAVARREPTRRPQWPLRARQRRRTSTASRPGSGPRAPDVTVAVVDQDVDARIPTWRQRRADGDDFVGRRLHGRDADGRRPRHPRRRHDRRRRENGKSASPASRPRRTSCRCARSTTAATGKLSSVIMEAFDLRRRRRTLPIVVGRRSAPTRCCPTREQGGRSTSASPTLVPTPTPTRCSSSPPATRATTTTRPTAGLPVLAARPPNLICVGMTGRSTATRTSRCAGATSARRRSTCSRPARGSARPCAVATDGRLLASSGTSVAAPLVAGVAALRRGQDPMTVGPEQLKDADARGGVDAHPGLSRLSVRRAPERRAAVDARADLGAGGPAARWVSCDADHDGFDDRRQVPATSGTVDGCPDADGDGVRDIDDNCATCQRRPGRRRRRRRRQRVRSDAARRRTPTATARPLLDDRCPTVPRRRADGCPASSPTPPPTATPTPTPDRHADPPPPPTCSRRRHGAPKICPRGASLPRQGGEGDGQRLTRTATRVAEDRARVKRGRRSGSASRDAVADGHDERAQPHRSRQARAQALAKGTYRVTATARRHGRDGSSFKV